MVEETKRKAIKIIISVSTCILSLGLGFGVGYGVYKAVNRGVPNDIVKNYL